MASPAGIHRAVAARLTLIFATSIAIGGCTSHDATTPLPGYRIVRVVPHDSTAYTQGLVLADTIFYESTGLYGHSDVRIVDPATGAVRKSQPLSAERFGEGLALLAGRLYQLTWQSGVGYVYDAATLAAIDSFTYQGEGWGLATDGKSLIMSDGSDTLRFLDPATLAVTRRIPVTFSTGVPATRLNELEDIDGELFANVYQSDWILRIDPRNGMVREVLDLAALHQKARERFVTGDVLNGIAFDRRTGHLLVTGKNWATLFELSLENPPGIK